MKTKINMRQRVETAAIAGLVLLACGGASWARPPASEELSQRPGKEKQVRPARPAEIDRPLVLRKRGGLMVRNGQAIRTRRLQLGLPIQQRNKPGAKLDYSKPVLARPDLTAPGNVCGGRFGIQQILAVFKGDGACSVP